MAKDKPQPQTGPEIEEYSTTATPKVTIRPNTIHRKVLAVYWPRLSSWPAGFRSRSNS